MRNQHTSFESLSTKHTKSLHKVKRRGYDLRRVIAVDDNPEKYARSYGNLVTVAPYLGSLEDDELHYLKRYLEELIRQPNVRSVEKRAWRRRLEHADRGRLASTEKMP
ncbi:hypothetical protein ISP18_16965 [Dyella humi]|uniref:FCP1 homology domain-containing protein n=1 Tax=Dyella humi TaxID=1770547 RepID=A0ABW8IPY5_9GAMM